MMNALQQLFHFKWLDQQATMKLASSIMLAQLVYALGPFVNTFLAARLGHPQLAASALVNVFFFTLAAFGWGTLGSIGILSARYYGAHEHNKVTQVFQQGLVAAVLLSIPTTIIIHFAPQIMLAFGQNPQLVKLAMPYCHALTWAMPTMFLGVAPIEILVGLGKTRIIFIYSLIEMPLNILIKYGLVFGKWGLPKLGLAGIGWGIAIVCWTFLFAYLFFVIFYFHEFKLWEWQKQQWHHLKEIFQIGWPMGFTYIIEIGFFAFIVITMGHFSNEALAAYQITMQFLSFGAALIFAIGQATISRTGRALGAKNNALANDASISGIQIGWWFSLIAAVLLILFPHWLISIDINTRAADNALVVHYAKHFFIFGAFYILFDSMRVISACILRAYKDTRFAMYSSLLGFWLAGSLLALCFAYTFKLGPYGLMLGSLFGAITAMIILLIRYFKKHRHAETTIKH